MSTTSASAARDNIPKDVVDLSNHMYIFILTRGDATLFNASSILEQDVIEICIWLGHTHPEGVPWYSAIELVMLFHMADELQTVAHGLWKHQCYTKKPLQLGLPHLLPPMWPAYMVEVNGEPSGTQSPPSNGKRNPMYPLETPIQVGGPHNTCKQPWGSCGWCIVTAHGGCLLGGHTPRAECTPQTSPTNTLGKSCGNWGLDVDDQEVTFLKGGGWVPPEQPFWPPAPAQPDGGWEPRGQPPHPSTWSTWWRCGVPNKYTSHMVATQYPSYQHLQWWCYVR